MTAKSFFIILARLAVGGVFLYAGVIKIIDPVAFAGNVAAYRLLPYFGSYVVAAVLPWIEAVCGLLLITNLRMRGAATLLFMLNLSFMAALVSVIVRGFDIDCGCFRQGGEATSPWTALGRDGVIALVLFMLLQNQVSRVKRTPPQAESPTS